METINYFFFFHGASNPKSATSKILKDTLVNPADMVPHFCQLTKPTGAKRADKRLLSSVFTDVQHGVRRVGSCVVAETAEQNVLMGDLRDPFPDATAGAILKHGLENRINQTPMIMV